MNKNRTIDTVAFHTIKKLELIERYIEGWSHKLISVPTCKTLVFIDCMCNSGEYLNQGGEIVEGTALRVCKILKSVACNHNDKIVKVYLNDIDSKRIESLKKKLPGNIRNFHVYTNVGDGNDFLRKLAPAFVPQTGLHCFLLYDPYDASIDWGAIKPFFNLWGEVLINHMISDTTRALKVVKNESAIKKYERTYLEKINELIGISTNKTMFEDRIEKIIQILTSRRKEYFVSVFPFFNSRNALLYYLIFGSGSEEGFKLFKESAWKVFEGHSSVKHRTLAVRQLSFNFDAISSDSLAICPYDEQCYGVADIVDYVYHMFHSDHKVPLQRIWDVLDTHPVFPSKGFRKEIKSELKRVYKVRLTKEINQVTGKRESFIYFR